VDAAARDEILSRYADHVRRFDEVAARLRSGAEVTIREPRPQRERGLTTRELELRQLIAEGLTNREIGQRLSLSEETVKVHMRRLYGRLQARSRAYAVAIGFRRSIIT
jgi:DNA-binding NarL/FixJ family response regulator